LVRNLDLKLLQVLADELVGDAFITVVAAFYSDGVMIGRFKQIVILVKKLSQGESCLEA